MCVSIKYPWTDEEVTVFSGCELSMSISWHPCLKAVLGFRDLSQCLSSYVSPRGTRGMLRGKRKENQGFFIMLSSV